MPPNQALPCSLHQLPLHFLHEELHWAVGVYLTYSTHFTALQFTPLKNFQDWMEERLDSAVTESHKGGKANYSFCSTITCYLTV